MKHVFFGLALGLAALPGAAAAQDGAKLDCVIESLTADEKQYLAKVMAAGGEDPAAQPLFQRVGLVAKDCVARHNIPDAQGVIYLEYVAARILRDWVVGEMARQKIATRPIDAALGFGPRRTAPQLSNGLSEQQYQQVEKAYRDAGIDLQSLEKDALSLVGVYAASTSIYWTKRAALGD